MSHLLVLNKDEDTLSVVDLDTKQVIKTVPTSHNPHELVITPDGKKTYIACSLGNTIDIFDNQTLEITGHITHEQFDFPHGLDVTRDGRKLYLASTFSALLYIIDVESDTVEDVIPTHQTYSHMISFDPDQEKVYVPNIGSQNISVFDTATKEFTAVIPTGKGPEGIGVHPRGHHLYVANQDDDTLYVIDINTHEILFKRRIGHVPVRLVFSPDGKYALTANRESNDVSVILTEQRINETVRPWEIKRIPVGLWAGGIVFSPDGGYAYVANNKTNDISLIDMNTLKETERIDVGIHPDGIAYLK
ncbi:YncE family protein [Salisediminibacterium beveridgei]|uniref:40-residue YVTN family beta-propeller repeat protein n=1 Tax=Salisediminibacterium beveridgei TaxID=632773 RepID=A0A1D7QT58_9BACI|nr:YncE family protein [Salisediminibacterium beveridgei]AOM82158.1 40-residue YVTN family beta-propeller repeat protein [Salisediminibacterium beveridgei]